MLIRFNDNAVFLLININICLIVKRYGLKNIFSVSRFFSPVSVEKDHLKSLGKIGPANPPILVKKRNYLVTYLLTSLLTYEIVCVHA